MTACSSSGPPASQVAQGYMLSGRYEWLATDGPDAGKTVSHWTIISQHLTKQAAIKNLWNKDATLAKDVDVITAS